MDKKAELFFLFLDSIDLEIVADIQEDEIEFKCHKDRVSYALYIRITEIFHSIIVQIKEQQPMGATMLLRPLSEVYILMKTSLKDSDFYERFLKHSAKEKRIGRIKPKLLNPSI